MTSKQQSKPDYGLAQQIAYETVLSCNQQKLPLSIKKLIKSIPNLHIQKYSSFAKKRGLTLEETYEITDSEEGCLWMRNDGQYIILYNELVENTGRIRFTLAHELGHYLLKHNEKTKKTLLARYSLTNEEYDIFEKEANYFAKRLLAPIPLVDLYVASWSRIYPECIEFAFDTSFTVANYIINDLHRRQRNANIVSEGHPLTNNFVDFIKKDTSIKICTICHAAMPLECDYCVICGSDDAFVHSGADTYANYYIERKKSMLYTGFPLNEYYRARMCPKCGNERLTGSENACQICGTNIMNRCLGDSSGYMFEGINTISATSGCDQGKTGLPGDARFCPHCGGITTYAYQRLLTPWEQEYEAASKAQSNSNGNTPLENNLTLITKT